MVKVEEIKTIGIVKHINTDQSVEAIENEVKEKYPGAKCDLFKRPDESFTGTMKVTFADEETLNNSISNRFTLFNQRYLVEVYKPKPKVIKCNRCQRFGHVGRLCRSINPKCGKCCSVNHETNVCSVEAENYKCAHCSGGHMTGDKKCEEMINKEADLLRRRGDR